MLCLFCFCLPEYQAGPTYVLAVFAIELVVQLENDYANNVMVKISENDHYFN